jgi:hypothetical protein
MEVFVNLKDIIGIAIVIVILITIGILRLIEQFKKK